MSNINISDMGNDKKLTADDLAAVKGGPAYMKIGDIKGELSDRRSSIRGGSGSGKVSL